MQVQPSNDLQFITSQALDKVKSQKSKGLCDLRPCDTFGIVCHQPPTSANLHPPPGACYPSILNASCSHVQPHGSAPAECLMTTTETKVVIWRPAQNSWLLVQGYHSPVSVLGSGRVDRSDVSMLR